MLKPVKTALLTCVALTIAFGVSVAKAAPADLVGKSAPEIKLSGVVNIEKIPTLADLRGKPLLLEFWATWCPHCLASIPHLQELYTKYSSKGLQVLAVSAEKKKAVEKFVKAMGEKMTYPIGIDNQGQTTTAYRIRGIPTAFLIDKNGVVRWAGHPMQLSESMIKNLLAGGEPVAKKGEDQKAVDEIDQAARKRIPFRGKIDEYKAQNLKKWIDVEKKCEEFLKKFPKSKLASEVVLRKMRAFCAMSVFRAKPEETAADMEQAENGVKELLKRKADKETMADAHVMLISRYVNLPSKWDKIFKHGETVLKKYPKTSAAPVAAYYMARTYERQGNTDKAVKMYKLILEKYPKSPYAKRVKGIVYRLEILGKPLTDLSFTALDGRKVDIKDYKGKVVLIDFWATWCGPCRHEMPNIKKVYAEHHKAGFDIIGISLDKDKKQLQDYLQKEGIEWPQYFDGKGWENEIAARFGIGSIPSCLLIDRKGVVREMNLRGPKLEKAVVELLAEQ